MERKLNGLNKLHWLQGSREAGDGGAGWSGGSASWAAAERKSGCALQAEGGGRRGNEERAAGPGGGMGTAKRAEKDDDSINPLLQVAFQVRRGRGQTGAVNSDQ